MNALSPELLAQIKAIELRTRRLVTDALSGDYKSAFRGRGMEFEEVREYRPGDDVRRIDWNVTAKTGAPHIKEHKEERELTVMLLVDVSASGRFGSGERLLHEVLAEVAAVLTHVAMRSNDKVGVIVFSDEVEHYIPPKKGRAHLWRVVREVLTYEPRGHGTSIAIGLEYLLRVARRRSVVFLLSDFLDTGYEDALRRAAKRHDITAVALSDPRAKKLPSMGLIDLIDRESGRIMTVDTYDRRAMAELDRSFAARDEERRERFLSAGVDEIAIDITRSYVDPIVRYFQKRDR